MPNVFKRYHGYHSDCYKKFTAIKSIDPIRNDSSSIPAKTTRSSVPPPTTNTVKGNVLPRLCIFCDKGRKKYQQKWVGLCKSEDKDLKTEVKIRKAAKQFVNNELLMKIGHYEYGDGPDFTALEVHYHHHPCLVTFLNKLRDSSKAETTVSTADNKAKKAAKKEIVEYIANHVIMQQHPMHISDILLKYKKMFTANSGSPNFMTSYTTQNFSKMSRKAFPESVFEIRADAIKKMVVFKANSMPIQLARAQAKMDNIASDSVIWECAMKLRSDILNMEVQPLEEPLTVDSIMNGEVQVPDSVNKFLTVLYTGNNSEISKRKQRFIDSTAADVVYASSGGKLLPGKHLALALALKSMTGSRTVTSLINRFGHCASNEKARRIDMGLESTITQTSSIVPDTIVNNANTSIALAWDNFN